MSALGACRAGVVAFPSPALSDGGAGESVVVVTGSCAAADEGVLHREGDTWLLRGIAAGGIFRMVLEIDDAGLVGEGGADEAEVTAALHGALPRDGHPRRGAGIGPGHESVLRLVREALTGDAPEAWAGDRRVSGAAYCELDLRATADLDPDDAVLLAAQTKVLLGRRHDSLLMGRVRHERPLAYAVRDTVLDCDGRLELRLRIGGDPAGCEQRVAAAVWSATETVTPAECALALQLAQARLDTEALGGGEQGVVALDLADRLRGVIAARGTKAASAALATHWRELSWTVEHEHERRDEGAAG